MTGDNGQKSSEKKHTILLVDDEDFMLDIGQGYLKQLGHDVITAQSGYAAIEIYMRKQKEISLVILDLKMQGLNGGDTLVKLKEIDPQIKVLISTGYYFGDMANELIEKGAAGFLQKSFF